MQIKNAVRYDFIPVRMAIRKKDERSVGEDAEKKEHLYSGAGTVNWYSHYGKQYGGTSRN